MKEFEIGFTDKYEASIYFTNVHNIYIVDKREIDGKLYYRLSPVNDDKTGPMGCYLGGGEKQIGDTYGHDLNSDSFFDSELAAGEYVYTGVKDNLEKYKNGDLNGEEDIGPGIISKEHAIANFDERLKYISSKMNPLYKGK